MLQQSVSYLCIYSGQSRVAFLQLRIVNHRAQKIFQTENRLLICSEIEMYDKTLREKKTKSFPHKTRVLLLWLRDNF